MVRNRVLVRFRDCYVHRSIVFAVDVLVSLLSTFLSYLTLISWLGLLVWDLFSFILLFSLLSSILSILLTGSYRNYARHTTISDVWRLLVTSLCKVVIMSLLMWSLQRVGTYPILLSRFVYILLFDYLLTTLFLMLVRVSISSLYNYILRIGSDDTLKRVLIYGDSRESVSVGMLLIKDPHYNLSGFILPTPHSSNTLLGSRLYTLSDEATFRTLVKRHRINMVVFPDYNSARREQNRLLCYCARLGISQTVMSGINEIDPTTAILPPLHEVRIEDLLGREEVQINMEEISEFLTDKVVLVSGAAGSIGGELCRQLLAIPIQQLILLDSAETPMNDIYIELKSLSPTIQKHFVIGDIRNQSKLDYLFRRYRPNVVFHAAAYKHVPMMEHNPVEAVNTNIFGTLNIAQKSVEYQVEKFVMISTDKAVNPANVMGATKRVAEIYTQSLSRAIASQQEMGITRFVTTRFGNVLGSNGSVIPLFKRQISEGGPVTVTDPRINRYFMTISEACRLVMEAAAMGRGDEIFVFDMGDPVRISHLAEKMIALSGLELNRDIRIEYVGLRPGEKLYEELLNNGEETIPTQNSKIFQAKVREYDYNDVVSRLEELEHLAHAMDRDGVVAKIKEIVPEYKSINSEFRKLDKRAG